MANDRTTIIIDADASGVAEGVKKADQSLGKLNASVQSQDKNLNRYGEKLGQAFGPGQGLHGRLENLETPLRDTEGAMARAQMAFLEFGNSGATAADKVGAGFLLAGDAIASFMTGGVVGVAIAAAVAGFSIINHLMTEEAETAKKAEEAQKKHAEELANVGKAAVDAGISIAALQAKEAAGIALAKVRAVEQDRIDQRLRKRRMEDRITDLNAELRAADNALDIGRINRELKEEAAALKAQDLLVKGMTNRLGFAKTEAKEAQAFYLNDLKLSSESAVTAFVESTKRTTVAAAGQILEVNEEAKQTLAKTTKEAKEKAFDLAKLERQIRKDNADFDAQQRQIEAEHRRQEQESKFTAFQAEMTQQERLRQFSVDTARQRQEAFMKANAVQIAAVNAVVSGLQQMAHDGEISFAKLADAAATAAGNQLVASGTKHLLEGAATALGGLARSNPIAVSAGTAESLKGAAMITAGIGLGAIGGSIGRGAGSASTPASTPTDTRESRAASGSSGGEGGTTIINFNGPAYDRRGVANVITSGQRMAKHRRIAGA